MFQQKNSLITSDLELVRNKFEDWRKTRKNRNEKIPDELWQSAGNLIGHYKLTKIASTLRLNSNQLKEKINSKAIVTPLANPCIPDFVELDPLPIKMPNQKCSIEMEDKTGSKIKITVNDVNSVNLAAICQTFWSK